MAFFGGLVSLIADILLLPAEIEAAAGKVMPPMYPQGFPTPDHYRARISFGSTSTLSDENLHSLGGLAPRMQLRDDFGRPITLETWGGRVSAGSSYDYLMAPVEAGKNPPPVYISVETSEDDAICISSIVVSSPTGGETTITGDYLHAVCGWPGYASATRVTIGEAEYQPFCIWAGVRDRAGPNTASTMPQYLTFHLQSLQGTSSAQAYNADSDLLCKSPPRAWSWGGKTPDAFPIFDPPLTFPEGMANVNGTFRGRRATAYDKDIVNNPAHWKLSNGQLEPRLTPLTGIPEVGLTKRDLDTESIHGFEYGKIADHFEGRYSVVNSTSVRYSAVGICARTSFVGPDWANAIERKYCEMKTRRVYNYCGLEEQEDCWDEIEREIRGIRSPLVNLMAGNGANGNNQNLTLLRPKPVKKLHTLYADFGDMI